MGGKFYMLEEIVKRLDYSKICYIELFGGSGKVLLNKPKHKIEIYNDYDDEIFNLWYVLQNHCEEFKEKLEGHIYCEKIFKYYKNMDVGKLNPVDRAVRSYILINFSHNGLKESFSYGIKGSADKKYYAKIDYLKSLSKKLKNITILNRDYKSILSSIKNNNDVMIYADPPYFGTEYYYRAKFAKDEHYILAEMLNELGCSIMVSYYEFEEVKNLYPEPKWRYYRFKKTKHSYALTKNSISKIKPTAEEILILNYDPDEGLF